MFHRTLSSTKCVLYFAVLFLSTGFLLVRCQDADSETTTEVSSTNSAVDEVAELLLAHISKGFQSDNQSGESGELGDATENDPGGSTEAPSSPTTAKPASNIFRVPGRKYLPQVTASNGTPQFTPEFMRNEKALRGWISDEIAEALWAFAPAPKDNRRCNLHGQLFKNSIRNYTLWAIHMLESSTRISTGLTSGSLYQMGHFDECIDIEVKDENMEGKYCLATFNFAPDEKLYPGYHVPDTSPKYKPPGPYDSAWDAIKPTPDVSRRRRDLMYWSVCVPSSCTAADVEQSLNALLKVNLAQHGLQINVSLADEMCYAKSDEQPFSLGFFIVMAVLALIFLIVLHATWMDMFYYQSGREHSKTWRKLLKPFSAYTNMTKLLTANPDREFSEFHYLKLYAMACVISGHRQMTLHGPTPNENPWWLEWTYDYFPVTFLVNGGLFVDVFFFLSGFLTCHYIYKELEKRKRLNLVVIIINRWLRIAPVYMFVMAVYAWVLPYTGDGPLWKTRIGVQADRCVSSWWINLLFLNNYINPETQCMVQAWYLACDMHFFIVGSLIVYAAWKWKSAGNLIMWGSLLISIIIPGYITWKNNYWGVVFHYNTLFVDPVKIEHFRAVYMASHTRFGPYVVGMIGAYMIAKLKEKNYQFSLPVVIIGSAIAAMISFITIVSGYVFYIRDRPFNLTENILYAALHRSTWSAGIVWFFVVENIYGYGILYDIFKHPFFTAFGRLTYCAYLVHVLPQLIQTSTARLPEYLDFKRMFWYSMGDFTFAYILALVLNLLFEAPLERVQKKILKKLIRDADAKLPKKEVNMNGNELTEVKETAGVDNLAMDKTDITA